MLSVCLKTVRGFGDDKTANSAHNSTHLKLIETLWLMSNNVFTCLQCLSHWCSIANRSALKSALNSADFTDHFVFIDLNWKCSELEMLITEKKQNSTPPKKTSLVD